MKYKGSSHCGQVAIEVENKGINFMRMFNINRAIFLVFLILPLLACASSMPAERRDYILSRPHGFVEITITDSQVQNVKSPYDKDAVLEKPDSCALSIKANSEPFFMQSVYPDGTEQPYMVKSGFRFPIPIGEHKLIVNYHGCRANTKGEGISISAPVDISVANTLVYEIIYIDGQIVSVNEKPNDEVTLKQLLEAVKK